MAVQSSYNYASGQGVAGGLWDLSPYVRESRINEEESALKLGMGVVKGTVPGVGVKLPDSSSGLVDFEGVIAKNGTTPLDLNGELKLAAKAAVGVISSGRVWVRIKSGISPAYGKDVYLITSGTNAGLFTLAADTAEAWKIRLNARYLGSKSSGLIAPIELHYQNVQTNSTLLTDLKIDFLAAADYAKALPLETYTENLTEVPWLQISFKRQTCDSCFCMIEKSGETTCIQTLPVTEDNSAYLQLVVGNTAVADRKALHFETAAGDYVVTLNACKEGAAQTILQKTVTYNG